MSIDARLTLRLNEFERENLGRVVSSLRDNGVDISLHKVFKFIIKGLEPDLLTKQIVKSKKQAEKILEKAKSEASKLWF